MPTTTSPEEMLDDPLTNAYSAAVLSMKCSQRQSVTNFGKVVSTNKAPTASTRKISDHGA